MNSSFSHFIVNKKVIDLIGYFDERLLGFGEEDGDITYRLLKNGINVNNIMVDGLVNIVSNVRHDSVVPGIGKYSKFNRDFIYNQKYRPDINSPLKGLFDTPMKQKLDDLSLYPYERFFIENKGQL
jgi:predicted glycosyltransferase involved in capsule biosynthesis